MSKPKQKKTNYNDDIIKALMAKYGFKRNYILMSIRGERNGLIPIRIQEEYKALDRAAKAAVNKNITNV